MHKEHISSSLFLHQHPGFHDFASAIEPLTLHTKGSPKYIVICERKEDLIAVRAALSHLISPRISLLEDNQKFTPIAGIAMYTIDALCDLWMKSLLVIGQDKLSREQQEYFSLPFLDIVAQENMLKILLLRLRFASSDALSAAKQLLTLLDIRFPPDENLLSVLVEAQNQQQGKIAHKLNETSLKQLLCAYQGAKSIFQNFCRTQTFVATFIEELLAELRPAAFFDPKSPNPLAPNATEWQSYAPPKLLDSHLLWVCAPEYGTQAALQQGSGFKPGNFQASVVNALRQGLFTLRRAAQSHMSQIMQIMQTPQTHLCRFLMPTEVANCQWENAEAQIVSPPRILWEQGLEIEPNKGENALFLLADFATDNARTFCESAHGMHFLHEEELEVFALSQWQKQSLQQAAENSQTDLEKDLEEDAEAENPEGMTNSQSAAELLDAGLQNLWNSLYESVWLIEKFFPQAGSYAKQYDLVYLNATKQDFLELWKSYCFGEKVHLGSQHPMLQLPRALSLFSLTHDPQEVVAFGRPHAPRTPSLTVKIMNDVMLSLVKKGLDLELPASEESYRGFYLWLLRLNIPIRFLITNMQELEQFPNYLSLQSGLRVSRFSKSFPWSRPNALASLLGSSQDYCDPSALQNFQKPGDPKKTLKISVTQFEEYVTCPLRFYMEVVLGLKEVLNEGFRRPLSAPPKETGIRTHRLAELFISLSKLIGQDSHSNTEANQLRLNLLRTWEKDFSQPNLLIFGTKEDWKTALQKGFERMAATKQTLAWKQLRLFCDKLIEDLVETVFLDTAQQVSSEENIQTLLATETVKRAFLRLIWTESERLTQQPDIHQGSFTEIGITINLHGVELSGTIDRIDTLPHGVEIIDYKTSHVGKMKESLSLLPMDKPKNGQKLSVQGAMYCLGWAQLHPEIPIAAFTLYRLKNLNKDAEILLSASLPAPPINRTFLEELYDAYQPYVAKITKGEFPAEPSNEFACRSCPAITCCPLHTGESAYFANSDSQGLAEEEETE